MTFINKLQNYHPSEILRDKRVKKLESHTQVKSSDETAEKKVEEPVDEEDTIMAQAQEYLSAVSEGVMAFSTKLDQLNELAEKASKASLPDLERKTVIKEFGQKKTELDQMAATKMVGGEPIFSGKIEMKGKHLKIDKEKEMELKIKAFDSKSLGLSRSRIDTTAVAEKTMLELEQAKGSVASTGSLVDQALNQIHNKVRAKQKAAEASGGALGVKTSVRQSYHLIELKRKQEDLAEEYGQTYGLLINTRI